MAEDDVKPDQVQQHRPWWWKLLGIRRRHGRWLRVAPSRWGWCLLILIALAVGSVGFAEYSMQPDFCRSCHLMEPYYQAWHESTHKDVPCADCHFKPGFRNTLEGKWEASSQAVKFLTGTYGSKPHAEVRDESCLREGCHAKRLLEGGVNWTVPTQRGRPITIRFDHTPHLTDLRRGKKLRCVSCHSQMVQGQHIVVTLDTCFLCHFKGLKHGREEETLGGCRSCHDAPQEQIRMATGMFNHADYIDRGVSCNNCHVDAVQGDGAVPRQVCWNCHNVPQDIARYGDSSFMHLKHVTEKKVECASCHVQIVHHLSAAVEARGDAAMTAVFHVIGDSGACGQCHERSHLGPAEMYFGTGGRGVAEMPSPMARAQVDCIACHAYQEHGQTQANISGQTFVAAQAACDKCHGTQYSDRLIEWRDLIALKLDEAQTAVAAARTDLDSATLDPAFRLKLQRLLDDAEFNVRFVQLAHGVHNVNYATALLSAAVENCESVRLGVENPTAWQEGAP